MTDIIVSLVIVLIIVLAILKIVTEKRKGVACVGCSQSTSCSKAKPLKKPLFSKLAINIKEV